MTPVARARLLSPPSGRAPPLPQLAHAPQVMPQPSRRHGRFCCRNGSAAAAGEGGEARSAELCAKERCLSNSPPGGPVSRARPGVTAYGSLHIYVRTATAQRECSAPPARQIGLVKTGGGGAGHPGSFPLAQTRMVQHILGRFCRAIPARTHLAARVPCCLPAYSSVPRAKKASPGLPQKAG